MDELKLYSVEETFKLLGICRQHYYNEINAGRLKSVKIGRRRMHTPKQIKKYFKLLEKEAKNG